MHIREKSKNLWKLRGRDSSMWVQAIVERSKAFLNIIWDVIKWCGMLRTQRVGDCGVTLSPAPSDITHDEGPKSSEIFQISISFPYSNYFAINFTLCNIFQSLFS